MTYNELKLTHLDPKTKLIVQQQDYSFQSTVHWCVGIYTEEFCEEHKISFKVKNGL